ncbi:DotA/TraY family protein [Methylobacillus sp. Pita2]|uniref:DotA/TraY family protein n=1 Tax=Methylobacillus sp. Pita2 TaxID=3383245 RepID=UPI0038B5E65E
MKMLKTMWKNICSVGAAFRGKSIWILALLGATAYPIAAFAIDLNAAGITPPPDSDVSLQAIGKITGLAGGEAVTSVLSDIMTVWNGCMMFIGTVIVGYIIIAGVLKSAHEGEVLGRQWSTMWIPARATIGLGMTGPIVAGYSAVQLLVVWVAIQGVGMADMMLSAAAERLAKNGGFISSPEPSRDTYELMKNLYVSTACAVAYNREIQNSRNSGNIEGYPTGAEVSLEAYGDEPAKLTSPFKKYGLRMGYSGDNIISNEVCGKFEWGVGDVIATQYEASGSTGTGFANLVDRVDMMFDSSVSRNIVLAQRDGLIEAYNKILPLVQRRYGQQGIDLGAPPSAAEMKPAMDAYMKKLTENVATIKSHMDAQGLGNFAANVTKDGWAMAGAYYARIGHMNAAANDIIRSAPNNVESDIPEPRIGNNYLENVAMTISSAEEDVAKLADSLVSGADKEREFMLGTGLSGAVMHPFLNMQNGIISYLNSTGDPMSRSQAIGHLMIDAAYLATGAQTVASLTPAGRGGKIASKLSELKSGGKNGNAKMAGMMSGVMGFINSAISVLFLAGAMLAYIFPMVPFILMLFAVMSWLTSFFIAVIASPLWAISHATPDGHEAFGSGSNGYVLLMSVTLRPSLTILAMFGSYAIMFAMDTILAKGYMVAFAGAQVTSATGIIGLVVGCLLYAAISLMMVYGCYRLVQTVPDAILQWVGGRDDDSIGVEQHNDKVVAAAMVMRGQAHQMSQGASAAAGLGKVKQDDKNSKKNNAALSPGATKPDNKF